MFKEKNNISTFGSDLTVLRRELGVAEAALLTAQVASGIPGPVGGTGGVSIPVLEREVEQLRSRISDKEDQLAKAKGAFDEAEWERVNLENLKEQYNEDIDALGCNR